jgi:hypothetical protein
LGQHSWGGGVGSRKGNHAREGGSSLGGVGGGWEDFTQATRGQQGRAHDTACRTNPQVVLPRLLEVVHAGVGVGVVEHACQQLDEVITRVAVRHPTPQGGTDK